MEIQAEQKIDKNQDSLPKIDNQELKLWAAIGLFEHQKLNLEQASLIADLEREDFEKVLISIKTEHPDNKENTYQTKKLVKSNLSPEKQSLLAELKALLIENFGDNIQDVILFGSQARGDAMEYSDYDILIRLKNEYSNEYRKKISKLIYEFEVHCDILVDLHLISENEFRNSLKGKEPVIESAIRNGLYL